MMWILDWLPNLVFHFILLAGILGLLASWILRSIPFIGTWALQIQVASIILTAVGIWYEGGIAKDSEYKERISALQLKVAQAETASAEANTQLAEELARNQRSIRDITSANQRKLKDLAVSLNKTCVIGNEVIDVLNNAAKNRKDDK